MRDELALVEGPVGLGPASQAMYDANVAAGFAALDMPKAPSNTSGIIPFDKRVLVLHDAPVTKIGSIDLPVEYIDKEKYAQTRATVIAVGDMAWAEAKYDAQQFGVASKFPSPGDRVLVGRYTGDVHKGADGTDYVVLNDSDIIAFLANEGK